jgi:hypothetical protein
METLEKMTEKWQCAICKECGAFIKRSESSTTGMKIHLERNHKRMYKDYPKKEKAGKMAKVSFYFKL